MSEFRLHNLKALDAGDIERIQKWPHCCRVLENFMGTIVEPAWLGLEKVDYVWKWRLQAHFSKDPAKHMKENPRNPIDAFEHWAYVMAQIRPGMMQMIYDRIEYTPNEENVPSPPDSKKKDWTFTVYVLRWMVIHDPTVSEENRDAYKTVPLSLGLIDKIERL